jgi:hypothetical protein
MGSLTGKYALLLERARNSSQSSMSIPCDDLTEIIRAKDWYIARDTGRKEAAEIAHQYLTEKGKDIWAVELHALISPEGEW